MMFRGGKKMKKVLCFVIALLTLFSLSACSNSQTDENPSSSAEVLAEENNEQDTVEYDYALTEGEERVVENTVFEEDVTISGDNGQILFSGCQFKGNIINTANEGTIVVISQSEIEGQCIFKNEIKETTMEASFPKFIVDSNVDVSAEDCIGAAIPMGDFEITFNGETYNMADSQLFFDISNAEAGFVPYEGQEANYYCVAQWWENGEKQIMVECEFDPNM